jgi:hypothetical protein
MRERHARYLSRRIRYPDIDEPAVIVRDGNANRAVIVFADLAAARGRG